MKAFGSPLNQINLKKRINKLKPSYPFNTTIPSTICFTITLHHIHTKYLLYLQYSMSNMQHVLDF